MLRYNRCLCLNMFKNKQQKHSVPAVCKRVNDLKPLASAWGLQKSKWWKISSPRIITGWNVPLTYHCHLMGWVHYLLVPQQHARWLTCEMYILPRCRAPLHPTATFRLPSFQLPPYTCSTHNNASLLPSCPRCYSPVPPCSFTVDSADASVQQHSYS